MKKSNKQIIVELCRYYRGEEVNPYMKESSNNRKLFWDYERSFFEKPNIFQLPDIEERFKTHIAEALDGLSELYHSFDKALSEYFETTP